VESGETKRGKEDEQMQQREFRRLVGFVAVSLQRLDLDAVEDRRHRRGRRWKLRDVLGSCLLGMMSGCRSLAEVEQLTSRFSRPIRRRLGIARRLPDTTMRDILCRVPMEALIEVLHRAVDAARRAKSLDPVTLPFHMAAMDGKVTALPTWDGPYAQRHQPEEGLPFGLMRTVTSTLVTARGKPCIDVSPIPASTNEMGHFQHALAQLCEQYGGLVTLVSYDQGANSEENAKAVLARDKHYLFRLNDERRHMQQVAMDLLDNSDVVAESTDVLSNSDELVRRLRVMRVNSGILPRACKSELWDHTRTLIRVDSELRRDGTVVQVEARYYATSLPAETLNYGQWLWAVRGHWAVETTHQILDVAFCEDDHPWIRNDAHGMLVTAILRRVAYTVLSLYRAVTQRSVEKRQQPWRRLLDLIRDALIASSEATVAALRKRKATQLLAVAA
jgi:hypothetical protein